MTLPGISTPGLQTLGILAGKRGLVMGVANNRSIAWGIAKAAREAGAELAFTYQGESLEKRVRPLAKELDAKVVGDCDVTDIHALNAAFQEIAGVWGERRAVPEVFRKINFGCSMFPHPRFLRGRSVR